MTGRLPPVLPSLMIERDQFGSRRFVRHWVWIGAVQWRQRAQDFSSEAEADAAFAENRYFWCH